ncbi:hypothetical protein PMAYCL1PPCAC_19149, partial [Pristionchus mayeri]
SMESHRQFLRHSDRVKAVDIHPIESWLLIGQLNGEANIWNYEKEQLIRSFKVCDSPVRAAVFVARKGWIITGSDDKLVRVFDYSTGECIHQFEAHLDFVRSIAVHPTKPCILTAGDDKLIKQWNWDANWGLEMQYEGHSHYVMQVTIDPKDNESFASASMDNTVKVWKLGQGTTVSTLEGHEKGVNCVDFYHGSDKSLIVSGADDHLVKIWDYRTKDHSGNVTSVRFHPTEVTFHPSLPLLFSSAESVEEGNVRVWNTKNYKLESVLNDGMDRAWCVQTVRDAVAVGYDKGCVVHKIGRKNDKEIVGSSDKKSE